MKFKEDELVEHAWFGKVRMFEQLGKYCLVKVLNDDLITWAIKRVQTRTLKRLTKV